MVYFIYWKNQNCNQCYKLLASLFGDPYLFIGKPGGLALWTSFSGKTLFGQKVCFDKILLKDENLTHNDTNPPHYDFLYVYVKVPISIPNQQKLIQLTDALGYDQFTQLLWVRCDSIDNIVVLLKIITDILTGQNSVANVLANGIIGKTMKIIKNNNKSTNYVNIDLVKQYYISVCSNLASLNNSISKSEFFLDEPWYSRAGGYTSNQPLDIKMGELNDSEYYNTLDSYPMTYQLKDTSVNKTIYDDRELKNGKASKNPNAYPKAPTGKPSVENFFNWGQEKKKKEMRELLVNGKSNSCMGACATRYANTKSKVEHLIPFNAYDMYNKRDKEHLISFNAYDMYTKKKSL